MRIGVIIPYYQREAGILRRALASIAAQELPKRWHLEVVVVDDSSPAPVQPELGGLVLPDGIAVTVLTQRNGGPGSARNFGLDHLGRQRADYVAFLDSDDFWEPKHLIEAVDALGTEFDFYFCDSVRTHLPTVEGEAKPRALQRLRQLGEPGVRWLGPESALIAVDPDRLVRGYLEAYLSQTSSVVLSGATAQRFRFDTRLRLAGEDYMYWFDLALAGVRTVISPAVNVHCGKGVNIYHSAYNFESTDVVQRVGYNLLFWKMAERKLTAANFMADTAHSRAQLYRRAYSYLFLRAILRGQVPSLSLLGRLVWEEPLLLPAMPVRFLSVLPKRDQEAVTW